MTKPITRTIYWNESADGWYDVGTDVHVGNMTAPARTTSINDVMHAIEHLAELMGWPCIDSDQAEDNFVMTFKRGGL